MSRVKSFVVVLLSLLLAASIAGNVYLLQSSRNTIQDKNEIIEHLRQDLSSSKDELARLQTALSEAPTTLDFETAEDKATRNSVLAQEWRHLFFRAIDELGTGTSDVALRIDAMIISDDPGVYVLNSSTAYHRDGCTLLNGNATCISLSDAFERGYAPCTVCKPSIWYMSVFG